MHTDEELKSFLASHGARVPEDFFLLWDEKTDGYSVCYFDASKRPSILIIEDEEMNERAVRFLQDSGVQVAESIDEITGR